MSKEEEKKQPTHYVISKSTRDTAMGLLSSFGTYRDMYKIIHDLYSATPVNIEKSQPKQKELPLEKAIDEKDKKEGK